MKRITTILVLIGLFVFKAKAQNTFKLTAAQEAAIQKLRSKVEANPSNLEAHEAFISAFPGMDNPQMEAQYKIWTSKYPKNYVIPFAIGQYYVNRENPKATPYLLQASILKPDKAETWYLLASATTLSNDLTKRREYLIKAMQLDSKNADYAFDYAESFDETDKLRHDSLALEVVRKFPESERAVESLFLLAKYTSVPAEKVAYFKQLYNHKANPLSEWYLGGTLAYFDLLLKTNPNQAFDVALTMAIEGKRNRNIWKDRMTIADAFLKAKKALSENDPKTALVLLNKVDLNNPMSGSYGIDAKEYLALFKAEAADAAKQTNMAFDSLAVLYSKEPTEGLHDAVFKYGSKLGMDSNSVVKSIWKMRNSRAIKATDFSLENFQTSGKTALSDYQGKLVLLTYWFPGCGPCRNEFPHFESVLKKFSKNDIVYLGLNLQPTQDQIVPAFLKETGYTFTPLHDNWGRDKGNLPAPGAPANYLIDQKGRIVFSGFRIDAENEKMLERMIKETLAVKD
ncbi:redoxin domain-containing protein [uncultured Mucilaginibacter sp.]|uniref:redoxin domain-containing protein n=1 Tax=uncultured Mucilaginibacter sp. TaxID=797541 RepID=UPI00261BAF01|nr:redoxin domain-containing protein [uncultured Mucilaginibacter sp.]